MADQPVQLSVKNPGRPTADEFFLTLPPSATVRELKAALQERYPGNPAPSTVTVSLRDGRQPRRARRGRHLAAPVLPVGASLSLQANARCPRVLQAIYAGRVLKDDNAVLSSFIVPVRRLLLGRAMTCLPWPSWLALAKQRCVSSAAWLVHTHTYTPKSPSLCRTRTHRCPSRCTL